MEKICAACYETFTAINSDESAEKEAQERTIARQGFHPGDTSHWLTICDDCYKKMKQQGILDVPFPN